MCTSLFQDLQQFHSLYFQKRKKLCPRQLGTTECQREALVHSANCTTYCFVTEQTQHYYKHKIKKICYSFSWCKRLYTLFHKKCHPFNFWDIFVGSGVIWFCQFLLQTYLSTFKNDHTCTAQHSSLCLHEQKQTKYDKNITKIKGDLFMECGAYKCNN